MTEKKTAAILFCGLGGLSRGFEDAGFEVVLAIDNDPAAVHDHNVICDGKATLADMATITPEELRALCPRRPDVLVSSPPCIAFSGCLPQKMSVTDKYVKASSLVEEGFWKSFLAWEDDLPPLVLIENVPAIQHARGRKWLDALAKLFQHYGYIWKETVHDCGELGHLAQHRRRFLGVARLASVKELLYEPPKHRVRGIGEVLSELPPPLPGVDTGWAMHTLGKLTIENWARLSLIRSGKDYRDLPERFAFRCTPRQGVYGVRGWDDASGTVVGAARWDNGTYSVADPRVLKERRYGLGVTGWEDPSHAIIGSSSIQNTGLQVADIRVKYPTRRGSFGVDGWDQPTGTIIGAARSYQGQNLVDPQVTFDEWEPPEGCIIGAVQPFEGDQEDGGKIKQQINFVWAGGYTLDLANPKPVYAVIISEDGWHRPMTTGELWLLQGFMAKVKGQYVKLHGNSHAKMRKRIGNAVPPPTARAIAESCMRTLRAHDAGGSDVKPTTPVWVRPDQIGGWYETQW